MGRVFMNAIDDPFRSADREIARVREEGAQVIFVDMHAETTSEKLALSYYVDGRVAAVIGTHTHVQTADERILPGGTACLTDAGMTGPHDGIIGMDKDAVIARFVTALPSRFETAPGDPRLNGVADLSRRIDRPRDGHHPPLAVRRRAQSEYRRGDARGKA